MISSRDGEDHAAEHGLSDDKIVVILMMMIKVIQDGRKVIHILEESRANSISTLRV